ncbi:hypothetical protein A2U01_0106774, partial [Trifolium medium]|nr:hypothetical protein [Trifolium medium]
WVRRAHMGVTRRQAEWHANGFELAIVFLLFVWHARQAA